MSKITLFYLLLLPVIFAFWYCGESKRTETERVNTDSIRLAESGLDSIAILAAPDWFKVIPESDTSFYAVATATSRRASIARDKAIITAQAELAKQLHTLHAPRGADSGERTDGEIQEILEHVVTEEQVQVQEGNYWRVYVLLRMKK